MRNLQDYLRKNHPSQKIGKEDQIRIILEETDFEKIHNVMEYLNWCWMKWPEMHFYLPSIEQLKQTAKDMLERVWDLDSEDFEYVFDSSGGFKAVKFTYDGLKMLSLHFELTGWEFDYEGVQSENYE